MFGYKGVQTNHEAQFPSGYNGSNENYPTSLSI